MRRVLFFPFRAVRWLLWLIFYPWYLRLFFMLPWWILAVVAAGLVSIGLDDLERVAGKQERLQRALTEPEPAIVALSAFDPAQNATSVGEVRLAVPARDILVAQDLTVPGPDMAYLPVLSQRPNTVGAVLFMTKLRQDRVARTLDGVSKGLPVVTVHGLLKTTTHRERVVQLLRADGFAVSDDVPFIDPITSTREVGLARALGTSMLFVYLAAGLGVLVGLMALWRFIRWIRRRRPRPPMKRAAPSRPAPVAKQGPWGGRGTPAKPASTPKTKVDVAPASVEPAPAQVARPPVAKRKQPHQPKTPRQMVDDAFGDILTRHKQ